MCVVSMIMDHYRDKWAPMVPQQPFVWPVPYTPPITPEEIAEFRRLLDRAREYDRRNNEPDCELEEKKEAIRKIAKALGIEIGQL